MNIYDEFQTKIIKTELVRNSPESLWKLYHSFTRIPYENATKIIRKVSRGADVRTPIELFSDFIESGAGGTCFSLVFALYHLLRHFHFDAHIVLADRTYGENTHAALIVHLDELYLLDPGYLIPHPLKIPPIHKTSIHPMPMNQIKLDHLDGIVNLSTIRKGNETFRYKIKTIPVPLHEYQTIWESSFDHKMMENVFMTKLIPKGQLYVRENRVEIITPENREKYYLNDDEFSQKISSLFGISTHILKDLKSCQNLK